MKTWPSFKLHPLAGDSFRCWPFFVATTARVYGPSAYVDFESHLLWWYNYMRLMYEYRLCACERRLCALGIWCFCRCRIERQTGSHVIATTSACYYTQIFAPNSLAPRRNVARTNTWGLWCWRWNSSPCRVKALLIAIVCALISAGALLTFKYWSFPVSFLYSRIFQGCLCILRKLISPT